MKEVQLVEQELEILEDVRSYAEVKVVEDLIRYELNDPRSYHFFLSGANLKEQERIELIQLLIANIEVFKWTAYEMPGINPYFIKHELNILSEACPAK